eukprot:CAMPEP_0115386282 /NCGR_PEP_ID=MMETSP0271-20121206/8061_1 /TAXON_ID=71861 /ORGANISM="Scrippsiella trochoidea, Strain CCMP3099" /LENGTH=112 /DNA_ID=CAMNT_0002809699 /DNA_START=623 /DNA_END=961 /DNA_ORIENTATION=-
MRTFAPTGHVEWRSASLIPSLKASTVLKWFLITTRQPAEPVTATSARKTESGEGGVNISPQTAAVSKPSPTNPTSDGSCPAPPPAMTATWSRFQSERATMWISASLPSKHKF